MPYGKDKLFLPVRTEIRKRIKKEAGDYVHVILYPDTYPTEVPDEKQLHILYCSPCPALSTFDYLRRQI